jgi:hypothetical protein
MIDAKLITSEWKKNNIQFTKKGQYLYRISDVFLVGIFLKMPKMGTTYDAWVEVRSTHTENAGLTQRRFTVLRMTSIIDDIEAIKKNTPIKDDLRYDDLLDFFNSKDAGQLYRRPESVWAAAICEFRKTGLKPQFSDAAKYDWRLWPDHYRRKYDYDFKVWAAAVLETCDNDYLGKGLESTIIREGLQKISRFDILS